MQGLLTPFYLLTDLTCLSQKFSFTDCKWVPNAFEQIAWRLVLDLGQFFILFIEKVISLLTLLVSISWSGLLCNCLTFLLIVVASHLFRLCHHVLPNEILLRVIPRHRLCRVYKWEHLLLLRSVSSRFRLGGLIAVLVEAWRAAWDWDWLDCSTLCYLV